LSLDVLLQVIPDSRRSVQTLDSRPHSGWVALAPVIRSRPAVMVVRNLDLVEARSLCSASARVPRAEMNAANARTSQISRTRPTGGFDALIAQRPPSRRGRAPPRPSSTSPNIHTPSGLRFCYDPGHGFPEPAA